MGGSAFSQGARALSTPRMPPAVYRHVRDQCHAALRSLFVCVATPIEGPAKSSFGDVDVLVSLERRVVFPTAANHDPYPVGAAALEAVRQAASAADKAAARKRKEGDEREQQQQQDPRNAGLWAAIYQVLGAVQARQEGAGQMNLAIPWPADLHEDVPLEATDVDSDSTTASSHASPAPRFVQVDVRLCDTPEQLQWGLFKHAHGDLWSILGTTIRPFGLTIDEEALYLRIPEIERANRRLARVELTRDPSAVLQFLGLRDRDGLWERPFSSVDDMFEYAATCRLFWVRPEGVEGEGEGEGEGDHDGGAWGLEGEGRDDAAAAAPAPPAKLHRHDRTRLAKRAVYRAWVEDFVPRCRRRGQHLMDASRSPESARAQLQREALYYFPRARKAYADRLVAWTAEQRRLLVRRDVIPGAVASLADLVPTELRALAPRPREGDAGAEAQYRGLLAGALRRIILAGDGGYDGIRPERPLANAEGVLLVDMVREWIAAHWREVGAAAWRLNAERCAEALRLKMEKRKAAEMMEMGGALAAGSQQVQL